MTVKLIALCFIGLAMVAAGAAKAADNPMVAIETSMGTIKVELFADKAPITVKNFLSYTDDKFYTVIGALSANSSTLIVPIEVSIATIGLSAAFAAPAATIARPIKQSAINFTVIIMLLHKKIVPETVTPPHMSATGLPSDCIHRRPDASRNRNRKRMICQVVI